MGVGAKKRFIAGFTLIELMIVIAIVSILASVALPAYNNQILKSRRTDAQREVVAYGQALERWFTSNGTYLNAAGNDCGVAYAGNNSYYGIAGVCTATTFKITAEPNTSGPQSADGNLTLTETGARGGEVGNGNWKY